MTLAAQTVADLRAGALINGGGEVRHQDLDERIGWRRVAGVDERIVDICAQLEDVPGLDLLTELEST